MLQRFMLAVAAGALTAAATLVAAGPPAPGDAVPGADGLGDVIVVVESGTPAAGLSLPAWDCPDRAA